MGKLDKAVDKLLTTISGRGPEYINMQTYTHSQGQSIVVSAYLLDKATGHYADSDIIVVNPHNCEVERG